MGAVVFFAFVLFAMGGVTAYMGDRLGSYIGKKRHSTFGLRPRHTAMLWTVVSGGVIAVGTLLLFLALNRTFSTALVRGPQLLEANGALEHQNRSLTRHNSDAERQAQADSRRAAQAQRQAREAQRQARDAQTQAAQARAALSKVVAVLSQAQSTLARSRQALAARQSALTSAEERLLAARSDLGGTRGQLRQAEAGVREAQRQFRVARVQAALADRQFVEANRNVLTLAIKQDQLRAANEALERRSRTQQGLLQASQGRSLVFRRDEELGRTVVSAAQPPEALRRELAVFLDQAELTARQRGAGGSDNSPAVIITAPGEAEGGAQAREAVLDALSESIAVQAADQPNVVVVATARFNTFKGEPVKLDLRPFANALVFTRGKVVAVAFLDGGQPDDVILKRLQSFLTGEVRSSARAAGIIPVPDPQSGEPLVGQPIDTPTALALVRQIRQAGPGAIVTAAAAADTYSADLLRLDLRVSPAPSRAGAARQ